MRGESSFENVELYNWIPFFGELAKKLKGIGPGEELRGYVKESLDEEGKDNLLEQKDAFDPFSFIYTLASKNTINQKQYIFNKVKEVFGLKSAVPTDWLFPIPSPHTTLFKGKKEYNPSLLWDMFRKSLEEGLTDEDCKKLIKQSNVGPAKLTQTLFLIDPKKYLPIDDGLKTSVLSDKIDFSDEVVKNHLIKTMGEVKKQFPGCEFYEINLFNHLLHKKKLTINEKYWQISTNVYGVGGKKKEDRDHWEEFNNESAVWTGGDGSHMKNGILYPLQEVKRGDVILCRCGYKGKGIGIVLDNEYKDSGWKKDEGKKIKVLWINKKSLEEDVLISPQNMGFSKADEIKNKFEQKYPETFELLKKIREMGKEIEEKIEKTKNDKKNLILQGAPGTGKTYLAKQLALYLTQENGVENPMREYLSKGKECSELFDQAANIEGRGNIQLIQFHPSYSYEDFVRGIVAKPQGNGVTYTVENKVLADLAEKASENPDENYVLIIDEINRANLPAVLGELIYALEYRGEPVKSMYVLEDGEGSDEIILPHNLYIIATMNTADRSIGHIDYAIRRRFIFQEIGADVNVIANEKAKALFGRVVKLFEEHLSSEFKKEDVQIGHSYFMVKDDEDLKMRWNYEIKPILNEYLKDGVLLEGAKEEIEKIYK